MIARLLSRLGEMIYSAAILIDVIACFIWLAPLYVVGLASKPNGHQMISAYVGRAAINRHRWAARAAAVIDTLFWWMPDHCQRMARKYEGFAD